MKHFFNAIDKYYIETYELAKEISELFSKLQLELIGDQEGKYGEVHLHKDIKQPRIAILLFAVALVGFSFNDYQFFGLSSEFYGLFALRLSILFYTFFELIQIGKVRSYRNYDLSITAYTLVVLICSGIINATRSQSFVIQVVITIIALFVICMLVPNRFINQILSSSLAAIGEAAIVVWFLKPSAITSIFTIFEFNSSIHHCLSRLIATSVLLPKKLPRPNKKH